MSGFVRSTSTVSTDRRTQSTMGSNNQSSQNYAINRDSMAERQSTQDGDEISNLNEVNP